MEQLVKKSVEDMVKRLKNISWFENCESTNATSKYAISYAKDVDSVIKHCSSTRWENLLLDKEQDVSSYITVYRVKTKYPWDDVVTIIKKEILPEILEIIEEKWNSKYGESKEIKLEIYSTIFTFLVLYAFREYKEEPFHNELLSIYEQGYFPCGWKGTYPRGKIIIF
ncbi:hypothetical protein [Clostridium felsineum]|uniref:hypothetical protein n=1 Tax=Clostridium felsineum TaxID=36839 RepID=UPI00098C6885|nr:hypothetical protein [Clostridium felsineum]URZ14177.1 hypothetical protein CLFE_001620 [Clostridium felsineum DSM 794]